VIQRFFCQAGRSRHHTLYPSLLAVEEEKKVSGYVR
jgi:hypothetical protein